ncbi:MAG: 30S ribosomal protein S6 [Bacteroidales bacterium]|jgi:small subunit ribosomal protein S6|nr:30S ribosomal protein S6 [Bacteroidales bacterium]MDY0401020.1 30S ribosomal protein S6 [Bacteroidales bacterium]HHW59404.1 30S ribosomal protein S6 [Bacteroidales bacterium]HOB77773.1 30S ribosomal protein S6 [Bacteroidales bacterium]HPZ61125.1 30S ribosomal protein S6 [Bacteroidales bacterium]
MVKHYETVFILTPVLSEEQAKETVKKYKEFLEQNGAQNIYEEFWGLRKLAYPIQKKTTGFYHLFQYETERNDLVSLLELNFRRDERVMRYLTVKLDKYGIEWNEKRKKQQAENKNKEKNKIEL